MGDVIGGNKIISKEYPMVTVKLPNQVVVQGVDYAKIPSIEQFKVGLGMKEVLSQGIITFPSYDYDDESCDS